MYAAACLAALYPTIKPHGCSLNSCRPSASAPNQFDTQKGDTWEDDFGQNKQTTSNYSSSAVCASLRAESRHSADLVGVLQAW